MCKVTTDTPPVSPSCGGKSIVVGIAAPSSSSESERPSRKRRVRFGTDEERVFEKDFTADDMCHIWYNVEEFMNMKSEIYGMIRYINSQPLHLQNSDVHDSAYYWRGFEHIKQKRPRKEIRRKHVSDLLYFHKVMSITDPVGLGLLAVSNSREALERARQLAVKDESEAFAIYNEDYTDIVSSSSDDESSTCSEGSSVVVSMQDDECEVQPINPMTMTICRGEEDSKTVRLLQVHDNLPALAPVEDDAVLSLMLLPYKLALLLFPCIC
ncbi:expressed unknown protein [Seminavis robusta]|uniref:Uncharacterized protein n=1 Tax=Seminavis robusta TaxID=568900 RepID=A0A9N8E966_9STRA|nr:expressed unknown protein [Seminavis robusta]CAB9531752.1 expressed unknown protein [Seminavis robusta]|eukprot:Sro3941_g352030.1 n/a (268) ;mRNA; r:2936-3739